MRHNIVEGEPGSMPWGQWRLLTWIRDHVGRRAPGHPVETPGPEASAPGGEAPPSSPDAADAPGSPD